MKHSTLISLSLALLPFVPTAGLAQETVVKMTEGGSVCHCPGSAIYEGLEYFRSYPTIKACLNDGGVEPREGQGQCPGRDAVTQRSSFSRVEPSQSEPAGDADDETAVEQPGTPDEASPSEPSIELVIEKVDETVRMGGEDEDLEEAIPGPDVSNAPTTTRFGAKGGQDLPSIELPDGNFVRSPKPGYFTRWPDR